MSITAWIVVAVVVVVAIIVIALVSQSMRRRRLQSQFGPEYERVAEETGSKSKADSELASRLQRRQKLNIRPLTPEQRSQYARQWQQVQADFVDQPYEAVAEADRLVGQVMQERGYPMENFEQHANDLSVDYPQLVDNYRGAHAVATRQRSANTEELRKAMLHYRKLFQELLGEQQDGRGVESRAAQDGQPVAADPSPNGGAADPIVEEARAPRRQR
jgi:hypothetical protein